MTRPALVLAALAAALPGCGPPPEVGVVAPSRGPISAGFTEPGRARFTRVATVAMPVAARLGRVDFAPGDRVEAGRVLAALDTVGLEAEVAEARARVAEVEAELARIDDLALENLMLEGAEAEVRAAAAAREAAVAQVELREVRAARRRKDLARYESLAKASAATTRQLDEARYDAETADIELREAEFDRASFDALHLVVALAPRGARTYIAGQAHDRAVARARLAAARARLRRLEHAFAGARVTAPFAGVVLARLEDGDRVLAAGTPLVRLGDPGGVEVVATVLSRDARRLEVGGTAALEIGAGRAPVPATVARVAPEAFTKVSALGVEQQRVEVVLTPGGDLPGIGHGYRVGVRFVTGRRADALRVPRTAIFRGADGRDRVLVVAGGRLAERVVDTGVGDDLLVEVTAGVTAADRVVEAPGADLAAGDAARAVAR